MLYIVYQIVIGLLFYAAFPLLLVLVLLTGKHRQGLGQRLGLYGRIPRRYPDEVRVWLHAASVGEVQAAKAIIEAMRRRLPRAGFVLTTMTIHGKKVATEQVPPEVRCLLAPLDVPLIVDHVLNAIDPDIYICLETELWPLLIHKAAARGARLVLVNGRMSEKSFAGYLKIKPLISGILNKFNRITVISESDRERFLAVGAAGVALSVEGNVKYDLALPDDAPAVERRYRSVLAASDSLEILVAGSTHTGEEEMLVALHGRLARERELLLILAPRHLERLPAIMAMLQGRGISFHRFSSLQKGERRRHALVLLDSLGELASLYSVGTFVFCGGSLVHKGGHNMMEAAIWGKPVLYGPSVDDFSDAAELLESAGAGFRVDSAAALEVLIRQFRDMPDQYRLACRRALEVARKQQGSALRQVEIVLQCLKNRVR
jgi:3-deoxy-D-manno-octulosonic-acid transferase